MNSGRITDGKLQITHLESLLQFQVLLLSLVRRIVFVVANCVTYVTFLLRSEWPLIYPRVSLEVLATVYDLSI